MSKTIELSVINGGIQRLRTKGGANPKSLYDLVNGYVTADKRIKSRPGTFRVASLPAGTVGLTAFDGVLHVFANDFVSDIPEGFELHVLRHPAINDSAGEPIAIRTIHFAEPFLGFMYVVAEFAIPSADADELESVYHYWLQTGEEWQASTWYPLGSIVMPSEANGLAYQATRLGQPYPSWVANAPHAENDIIEPTEYNDFYFTATSVQGTTPSSGAVEPIWPTDDGATVIEDADHAPEAFTGPAVTQPTNTPQPNPVTKKRYDNFNSRIGIRT